jgi:hypothetical protein
MMNFAPIAVSHEENKSSFLKVLKLMAETYTNLDRDGIGIQVDYQENGDLITIDLNPKKRQRQNWVQSRLIELAEDYPQTVVHSFPSRKILVLELFDVFGYECGTGIALCSDTDTYDEDTGKAVAFAKAIGRKIPDFI